MLVGTSIKANTVVTAKLVSGEELIGYFVSQDESMLTLRKPVVPVPTQQGTVGLAPFIMSSDYLGSSNGNIDLNKVTVITILPTSKDFADAYTQQVSGLKLSI